jgi:hypothetical protein
MQATHSLLARSSVYQWAAGRARVKPVVDWASGALALVVGLIALSAPPARAQEPPYQVTYSHVLEEPGNLEIAFKNSIGTPTNGNRFLSTTMELEYGATAWWTTELYLSGQHSINDSTVFTGYRWENRFRPLMRNHFINPVLYVEYEHISGADRSLLEITGHASVADLALSNALSAIEKEKSLETKLILSTQFRGFNFSENFIAEKEFNDEPWQFGYALGASRPLALRASSRPCTFCRENFAVGAEMYGGLGNANGFGWKQTSQYLGPVGGFNIPKGPTISFSPSFGLNANSVSVLYRFKVSYEIQQIFGFFHKN